MANPAPKANETNKPNVEAGKAIFRAMKPAKEARLDALKVALDPYKDEVRAALKRGVKKAEILEKIEELISHKLTAKTLDELLGGGTMRTNKSASTSNSMGA